MLDKVSDEVIVGLLAFTAACGIIGGSALLLWVGQGLYNLLRLVLGT